MFSYCLPLGGRVAGRRSIEKRSWSYTWVEGNPGPPGGCPEASADDQELQWPSGVVPPWGKGTWPLCLHISQSATPSCPMGGRDPEKAFLWPRRVPKEGLWSESSAAKNAGVTWWRIWVKPPSHRLPITAYPCCGSDPLASVVNTSCLGTALDGFQSVLFPVKPGAEEQWEQLQRELLRLILRLQLKLLITLLHHASQDPLPLTSTTAVLDGSSDGEVRMKITKGFELVDSMLLSGGSCSPCPLAIKTLHVRTRRAQNGSPEKQTYSCPPPLHRTAPPPTEVKA